jgi:hypothetical protein
MLTLPAEQPACWPASDTACKLASKLERRKVGLPADEMAGKPANKQTSKQANKKSGLPSGWSDGRLTKDTTAAKANLSHPPDLNGAISFALCEGHLTADFYTHQVAYFRVYCLA